MLNRRLSKLALIALLLIGQGLAATFAHVQGNQSGNNVSSSCGVGFSSNVTAGNLLVYVLMMNNGQNVTGISDTLGNTWTAAVNHTSGNINERIYIAYAVASSSGENGVTATFGSNANNACHVYEFSGVGATPLDVTVTGSGNSANPSVVQTTNYDGDLLVVGAGSGSGAWSAMAGWSTPRTSAANNFAASSYNTVSGSTGSKTFGINNGSAQWILAGAAFRNSDSDSPPPRNRVVIVE